MKLRVTFLGTGDYVPSQQRNLKSIHLKRGEDRFLFDAGEGVTSQLEKYGVKLPVDSIFLTSSEFDHCSGLPGLLHTYDANPISREEELTLFCPKGHENRVRDISYTYGDFEFDLRVKGITPGLVLEKDNYSIQAFETDALSTSIGYSLEEESRRGRFNREKAEELGVPPGPKFGQLEEGNSVLNENGEKIYPEEVLGEERPGRQVVYTGDTRPTDTVKRVARGADLLIHDSALAEEWSERAVETGHSTALEAGIVANEASVQHLALTNISPVFTGRDFLLKQEAESVYEDIITVARDGVTIDVSYRDTPHVIDESNSANSFYSVGEAKRSVRDQIKALRELVNEGYLDSGIESETLESALNNILENIDNSIMVLGSYDGKHEQELEEVKAELSRQGYDVNTALDLPSRGSKSLEQNIATYMLLSRFSIVVDRDPSGHISEYEIARRQRNVLARLVPEDSGSTFMIGGEEGVNSRNIKAFEFKYSPTEVLQDAIQWAENLIEERRETYEDYYPWR